MNLEKIFDNKMIGIYNEDLNILWSQIMRLNSLLLILEKVLSFPFRLFTTTTPVFWTLTIENIFSNCVLIICRIFYDNGLDILSLKKFKGFVFQNISDNNIKSELARAFKESKLDSRIENYRRKITSMRDYQIAHTIKRLKLHLKKRKN